MLYVAGLIVLATILMILIVQFYGIYRELISLPRADRTGLLVVDRITKELRSGSQIDAINSIFNSPNGVLDFDMYSSSTLIEKRFFVEEGVIKYQENGGAIQSLTPRDLYVSNFNFALVESGISTAVRFTMELEFRTRNGIETKSYTGFAILRESYD